MKRVSEHLLILYSLTGTISIAASQVVMALGGLVLGADRLGERAIRWQRTGLEAPLAAWALAAILATLFASDPAASADKLRKLPLLAMVFWPPAVIARRWNLGRVFVGLFFSAGVTSLYGVLTFFLQGGAELGARIRGFHGFYMTNSGLLLLCTFPALLFAFHRGLSTSYRVGAGLTALSILFAQLFGCLPGAWLGTLAGFLCLAWRRRAIAYAFVVPVVTATFFLSGRAPEVFREATRELVSIGSESNLERRTVWARGVELFARDPLSGWGLHDLRDDYARVASPDENIEGHMHSIPVHLAASMGLPGLLAFGWLIVAFFQAMSRARRRAKTDGFLRAVIDGGEAGLVAFLAAGLVEWNFGDSEILALLCFLMGAAIAAGRLAEAE